VDESVSTCWTVIRGAAAGEERDRETFARKYEPVIRAYFGARWRHDPLLADMDDAVQETFLDCFRQDGPLSRVNPLRPGGFRAFLFGVVRNISRRFERQRGRAALQPDSKLRLDAMASDETTFSKAFDRAWAQSMMKQAADLQRERAVKEGPEAERRVEILRLRFQEDLPIRKIARLFDADPAHMHHEYAKARKEFRVALLQVVVEHQPGNRPEAERECARLIALFG
jgi:RNA polymerase sigma-70 factor (ECF subfamily)